MQRELSEWTKDEMWRGQLNLEKIELAVRIKYFSDSYRSKLPAGVNVFHHSRRDPKDAAWIIESVIMTDGGERMFRSTSEEFPSEELRATLALLSS